MGIVDVDPAALVDEQRADAFGPDLLGDERAVLSRELPVGPVLVAPAVEDPGDRAQHSGSGVVDDEGRPRIAQPELVDRHLDNLDAVCAGCSQHAPRTRDLARVNEHRHRLELGDRVGGGHPRGVALLALGSGLAERLALPGKRHPGALVGRGFGGHAPGHGAPWVRVG